MSKFWDKVLKCDHKVFTDYSPYVRCEGNTPYCGASEYRCALCGVYIKNCGCGCSNGMSGWSSARWRAHWKAKAAT